MTVRVGRARPSGLRKSGDVRITWKLCQDDLRGRQRMANKKGMRCDQPTADIIGVPLHVWLILVQGLVWVLLPLIFEGSIRLDVAEGVIGGPEWQLSYFRHPPLSTWLTGLASMTGSARYAAVYLIGQSLALAALALVFVFVRRFDDRPTALLALMMGLASPFATYV